MLCWRVLGRAAGTGILIAASWQGQGTPPQPPHEYLAAGERALEWTRRFVRLGPRPAGSKALASQQQEIVRELSRLSCGVEVDSFVEATPIGPLRMCNIIARFGPAKPSSVLVISGHYDTFRMSGFVGANDGGSSAGLLMTLAERLDRSVSRAVWLVFFDGEESTMEWCDGDHTYGSRRLARRWLADGTLSRIQALLNVDMIGDADLELVFEGHSDRGLREQIWNLGQHLGYERVFRRRVGYIEDDHIPFLEVGVPSLALIDFEYGPNNTYWHTSSDKLDGRSFAIILYVLEAAIDHLVND